MFITGATGFVGQALLREALLRGLHVRAGVRQPTPGVGQQVEFLPVGDIGPDTNWQVALQDMHTVVHTAARVHVMNDKVADPLAEFRRVNVAGTLNLARQAAAAGVKRFVFVSSIKVNGEATMPGRPFRPDDRHIPVDPYGLSKYEAEIGLQAISAETGLEVVTIRPPLVYGPGVKANFAAMVRWLNRGWPLPLGKVEHNCRSLVAMDNLVDLLLVCTTHPAAAQQTFLVSDGEDLSTTGLLRRIAQALGKPARLLPVPVALLNLGASALGKADVAQRLLGSLQVDISKNAQLLGWRPPVSVDEGLKKVTATFI